jgi:hypothetical protein
VVHCLYIYIYMHCVWCMGGEGIKHQTLTIYLPIYLSISIHPSIHLSIIHLSIYPSIHLFIHPSISIHLPIFFIYLYLYLYLHLYLYVCIDIDIDISIRPSLRLERRPLRLLSCRDACVRARARVCAASLQLHIQCIYTRLVTVVAPPSRPDFHIKSIYLSFFLSIYISIYLYTYT